MKKVNREDILRMVGLHGAANLMRAINSIQLAMEEQDGKLVTYWTEIQKDEKQISLIAGRMTDAETNIGQLQVTAQQLTASVSSLSTTVSGHTTSIGQLQITADSLTASVSSLNTTVSGHTTSIGQLQVTANSISNRVTVIEGDYVKEAEISLMVKKDGNGYISNASIKADNILFTFTDIARFIAKQGSTQKEVMNINPNGDLWILGNLKGGNIQGNYNIGTTGNKMEIYVDEVRQGYITTSGLRGYDSNGNVLLDLRVLGTSVSDNSGNLYLYSSDGKYSILNTRSISFIPSNGGGALTFGYNSDGKVYIYAPISSWPSLSGSTLVGQVYLDNGYLKVRTS